jgi:two-component system sporulation sensor kinase C
MIKPFFDYQDVKTNKYIITSEVIFFLLASVFILRSSNISFNNFSTYITLMPLLLFLIGFLILAHTIKEKYFKYLWIFEFLISLIYLFLVIKFLRYEFQYLFKLTLIMPVIIIALKYGLKMAFITAFISVSTVIYLSYLRNFATIDADIILIEIMLLLSWLLGQMTENQYQIRTNLQLEVASRKKAERKISDQLCFLQNLIDTIPNPIYYTDLNLVFTGCNKAFKEFFGIAHEEIINKTVWDVFPYDVARKICSISKMSSTSELPNLELTLTNHEGSVREVIFNNAVVYDNDSQISGLLGVIIDITVQNQFQKEMARVERLNLVGEMAAGIAHEIRNPITTVKGFLQLYKIKSNAKTLGNHVDLMIEELDRANNIITEYLSLVKNKRLNLTFQNLNDIILSIAPLIETDAIISDKNLKLLLNDVPDALFDEAQMRQLLLNLSRNGLEAMEGGGTLTISSYLKDNNIVLEIKDQGKGIAPEIQEKIGNPFVTDKENGTGLGLAVCYSIATRHNASISYNTGPEGTTFYILFKVTPPPAH